MEKKERKAFNFYRSYYEIAMELPKKERLEFLTALIKIQFTGEATELTGMAKFAYLSQKHSIDRQLEGLKHAEKRGLPSNVPPQGKPTISSELPPPQVQVQGQVQVQEKGQVQVKVKDKEKSAEAKKLHAEIKNIFLDFYLKKFKESYYWDAKNATNLNYLIKKIEFKIKEKFPGENLTNEKIKQGFEFTLSKVTDPWLLQNFSIPNINSKFNELISQSQNKTPKNDTTQDRINGRNEHARQALERLRQFEYNANNKE